MTDAALRAALEKCRNQFHLYADLHAQKGTTDGDAKAQTNAAFVELCDDVLQSTRPAPDLGRHHPLCSVQSGRACDLDCPRDYTPPALERPAEERAPIDMILYCPNCWLQHVDQAAEGWDNPPHRSHLCHGCGCIWRPADVATNGVEAITTRGSADTYSPGEASPCVHCGDTGWVRDENWEPDYPGIAQERVPGNGLIRCGMFCTADTEGVSPHGDTD